MLKLFAAPVIGAIIGYCTNWIAVKMLFYPMEAKYIGRFHIPFTPGVIPKGKKRMAEAVSDTINSQLLTREAVKSRLMSEEILAMISETVCEMVEQSKCDVRSVRERICEHVDEDSFNLAVYDFEVVITERIMQRIKETEIGDLIAEHLIEQLNNAISSSFLGKMIGDSVVERFGTAISTSVDKYIDENGESFISNVVRTELFNMCETPVSNVINRIESSGYDILEAVIEVYKHFVEEKAYSAIKGLDIGAIAADSIRAMDNKELECLVMSAMKTELGAVVNLGALIGFVLGLINMTFYLL